MMIDIVTVCAGKDLENIATCIHSLNKNLKVGTIYVITNNINAVPPIDNVVSIDENDIISKQAVDELKKIKFPYSEKRFGWYFQQFLKMEFSRSKYCKNDYLIWDADTILLKNISFINDNKILFTSGEEKLNSHYVDTYKKLLKIEQHFSFSLISQHLFVNKNVMIEMLNKIENLHHFYFADAILKNINGDSYSLFSEYETYINYFANTRTNYQLIKRSWFRNAASICKFGSSLEKISRTFPDCDYVAMEKFDTTLKGKIKGLIKYVIYKLR